MLSCCWKQLPEVQSHIHKLPLSAPAVALLRRRWNERANDTGLVFSADGEKPMSDMTMTKLLRDGGIKGVTVHGFRSAFTDWAAEKTDFPKEVADKALAHKLTNQVEAAYRRTDFLEKRRDLMARWARHLDGGLTSIAIHTTEAAGAPIPARAAA